VGNHEQHKKVRGTLLKKNIEKQEA
jgi:hypothetical protein